MSTASTNLSEYAAITAAIQPYLNGANPGKAPHDAETPAACEVLQKKFTLSYRGLAPKAVERLAAQSLYGNRVP
jgi:hypothetical protein